MTTFNELWISASTLGALEKKWFKSPSPIQERAIPFLMNSDKDFIGQVATWTWKTAAFWIPIIENIDSKNKNVQAIILAPTRELALQVSDEISSFGGDKEIKIATVYWWQPYKSQISSIKNWATIVVWTPGRVLDLINKNILWLSDIRYFVLDEADEMLNMWFLDDIKKVLSVANQNAQKLFFSATMPKAIMQIANEYMRTPEIVQIETSQQTQQLVSQYFIPVHYRDKDEVLKRLLLMYNDIHWIVFCNMKKDVDMVANNLSKSWVPVAWLHWDIEQRDRTKILDAFKKRRVRVLLATDVAARGIDVPDISHVINYSLPQDAEQYVHRIWRTWRAWSKWEAISLATPDESSKLMYIKKITNATINQMDIPSIEDVQNQQFSSIQQSIHTVITKGKHEHFLDNTKELLNNNSPEEIIWSLLYLYWKKSLSSDWKDIISPKIQLWWGEQNLFVWAWYERFNSKPELISHIAAETWIDEIKINNLRMKDKFSFISMPYEDAQYVLYYYKKRNKTRPFITEAKQKK